MWKQVAACLVTLLLSGAARGAEPIRLAVDLRDAPRRIYHARETIPVDPGPLALRYPEWIPGEHSPSGPISDLAGLRIRAGGRELAWQRDPIDMYLIRTEVPAGIEELDLVLDYLVPSGRGRFTAAPAASARVAVLAWNTVLLHPDGVRPSELQFEAELTLPAGWQVGTALRRAQKRGDRLRFEPVALEMLIDSPVAAGAHYRAIPLEAPAGAPEHVLHVVADSEAALAVKPRVLAAYQRLVPEALALFGAHHYRRYDFLLALSDHVAHFGLEHHESSDNRLPERSLVEDSLFVNGSGLLPHEFVHSWNAKYRRPEGLATGDYQRAMVGDLIMVYEGLTSYLGDVLTARAGLLSAEQARDSLALQAAGLAHRKGREWRPLADTTRAAQDLYLARFEGTSWRRGVDFYDEGVMLWLEVDARIREKTGGAASLDDFCRRFFGAPSGPPEVKTYTRRELVAALAAVAPHDWEAFFAERVDRLRPGAPVEGIEAAGWKLAYDDKPNAIAKAWSETPDAGLDLRFSLGLSLDDESKVGDVVPGSAAANAGIGAGSELVAVNSRAFSKEVLADALGSARDSGAPLELLVKNADFFSTHRVEYRGGERHPHLVRDTANPDLLDGILAPTTWKPEAPADAPPPG